MIPRSSGMMISVIIDSFAYGGLADFTPTMLELLRISKYEEMTDRS